MPSTLVDILRLGFPGLAAYLLYLAYMLSRQVINLPGDSDGTIKMIVEKRKAVYFYGTLSFVALMLSIGVEIGKVVIPPKPTWISASAFGEFTADELKQRPLSLQSYVPGGGSDQFHTYSLSREAQTIQIPAHGVISLQIPDPNEVPK
jgi:hypothetical protein